MFEDGITWPKASKPQIEQIIANDGTICFVEPELQDGLDRRIFRRERQLSDYWEYCYYLDFQRNNSRARWYGFANKSLPITMTGE